MYKSLVRPALFKYDPEQIHYFTFNFLRKFCRIPGGLAFLRSRFNISDKRLEREVFGLKFKNPVGLAAGFDKDAEVYNSLFKLIVGEILNKSSSVTSEAI